jgi:uncharacterized protein (TIGR04255 family)
MSSPSVFTINLNHKFPDLKHPPGIEAVIYWQANATKNLNPATLTDEIKGRFPSYKICDPLNNSEMDGSSASNEISDVTNQTPWAVWLKDQRNHLIQFTSTGAVFTRLADYENGKAFQTEAMKWWDAFLELAAPTSIQKLGVRYISLIQLESSEQFSTYLNLKTMPLLTINEIELPTKSFFYQDSYEVPNHPYQIDSVITSKTQHPTTRQELIIDIQVFTTKEIALDRESLNKRLDEMRWFKSKIFFGCISETALEKFGDQSNG